MLVKLPDLETVDAASPEKFEKLRLWGNCYMFSGRTRPDLAAPVPVMKMAQWTTRNPEW